MVIGTDRKLALMLSFPASVNSEEAAEEALDTFFDGEHYESLALEDPLFAEAPDEREMRYIRTIVGHIGTHRAETDAYISRYARDWRTERISKTAAAALRVAICEILYMDNIPSAVSINETVEMAKSFDSEETVAFINGVLGSFVRGEGLENKGKRTSS